VPFGQLRENRSHPKPLLACGGECLQVVEACPVETAGSHEHVCSGGEPCLNDKAVGQPNDRTGASIHQKTAHWITGALHVVIR
jgi:hypothetical protein